MILVLVKLVQQQQFLTAAALLHGVSVRIVVVNLPPALLRE
jgi:hypothetical protein